jgi:hypothetical protein
MEYNIKIGTAVLGGMNKVISGIAKIENPKPESPCNKPEIKKIAEPISKISRFIFPPHQPEREILGMKNCQINAV